MSAPPRWLFWHRRDLRLADNRGLAAALAATPAVTGVVLLDPREWQAPDQAPARLWFWRQSLVELNLRHWRHEMKMGPIQMHRPMVQGLLKSQRAASVRHLPLMPKLVQRSKLHGFRQSFWFVAKKRACLRVRL